jgi:hypothetical protein
MTCSIGEVWTRSSRPMQALAQLFADIEDRISREPRFEHETIYIERRQVAALVSLARGAARVCVDEGDTRTAWAIVRAMFGIKELESHLSRSLPYEGWRPGDRVIAGERVGTDGSMVDGESLSMLLTAARYYAGSTWPCLGSSLCVDVTTRGTCAAPPRRTCSKSVVLVCGPQWSGEIEGWSC